MNSKENARIVARAKKRVQHRFGPTFYSSDSACIMPTVVRGQRMAIPKEVVQSRQISYEYWKNNVRVDNSPYAKPASDPTQDLLQNPTPPSARKQFMLKLWNLAVQTGIQVRSSGPNPDGRAGWATCKEHLTKLMTESAFASDAESFVIPVKYAHRILVENLYKSSEQSAECKLDLWGAILINKDHHHFPIQSFRIPHNTGFKLMPMDLYQIGYNVGQFKAVLKLEADAGLPSSYPLEIVQFYFGSKLDQTDAYVSLE